MPELARNSIGHVKRQAQPITPEMEDTLWEKGIFSRTTSRGLLNVVFWYGCKLFGLRAADEHKTLEATQFPVGDDACGHWKELQELARWIESEKGGTKRFNDLCNSISW